MADLAASHPHRRHPPRALGWSFTATVLGLVTLLVVPLWARQRVDHYRFLMDDELGPAHRQIDHATAIARKARSAADGAYFLGLLPPGVSPGTADTYFSGLQAAWRQTTARPFCRASTCGPAAAKAWARGSGMMSDWLALYGPEYLRQGARLSLPWLRRGDRLFRDGMALMEAANAGTESAQRQVRDRLIAMNREEVLVTIPLALLSLLLAGVSGRDALRLRQSWVRERGLADRLQLAVRETNHRVKNNLQLIGALLEMELADAGPTVQKRRVEELSRQIRAVAAVHDFLSHEASGDEVEADAMLHKLGALTATPAGLSTVDVEAAALLLPTKQATALALICSELLTNAGKHGATSAKVTLRTDDHSVELRVADNGAGFPQGFDPDRSANLGLALVQTLARHDLNGGVTFASDGGAIIEVKFPSDPAVVTPPPVPPER